ncbi:MAG: polyphosphate polymerase domain-containing protein [Acidimicrobiales bacterium]|nr:polyphosphate polymerase domain-containing protein [Acidimicrobiales bacterium]
MSTALRDPVSADVPAGQRPADPLDHLRPVSIDEVLAAADLQTRVDRKYLLTRSELDALAVGLPAHVGVLEIGGRRQHGYESTYHDTPELDSYLATARARPHRFKVRVRTYLDSSTHVAEVKTRARRGRNAKDRHHASVTDHRVLSDDVRRFVARTLAERLPRTDHATVVDRLRPVLRTAYQRTTLLVGSTDPDHGAASRATVDTALTFAEPDGSTRFLPQLIVVETKSSGPPTDLDRWLWHLGHRPTRLSKFGAGLALVRPDLPANRWHRVLHHHLAPPTEDPR